MKFMLTAKWNSTVIIHEGEEYQAGADIISQAIADVQIIRIVHPYDISKDTNFDNTLKSIKREARSKSHVHQAFTCLHFKTLRLHFLYRLK